MISDELRHLTLEGDCWLVPLAELMLNHCSMVCLFPAFGVRRTLMISYRSSMAIELGSAIPRSKLQDWTGLSVEA
jgi:hypothetical protein